MNLQEFNDGTPLTKQWLAPVVGNLQCLTINGQSPSGINYAQTASTAVVNTASETQLTDSFVYPLAGFKFGEVGEFYCSGVFSCLSATSMTLRLRGGSTGTTVFASLVVGPLLVATGKSYELSFKYTYRPDGNLACNASFLCGGDASSAIQGALSTNITLVNPLIQHNLNISVQFGVASPSNAIQAQQFVYSE